MKYVDIAYTIAKSLRSGSVRTLTQNVTAVIQSTGTPVMSLKIGL